MGAGPSSPGAAVKLFLNGTEIVSIQGYHGDDCWIQSPVNDRLCNYPNGYTITGDTTLELPGDNYCYTFP